MAVAIRLRREGSLNHPYYKVVVADQRSPRDGKFIKKVRRSGLLADANKSAVAA